MSKIIGQFRKHIFKGENGYVIGLFKIKETDDEELLDYVTKIWS